jgi:hypothetical protein
MMIGMRTNEWARYIHEDLGVSLDESEIADEVIAGHRAVTEGPGSTRGERSARPAGANASPSSFLPTRSRGKARARRHREFAPDPQALSLATRTITSLDTLDASSVRAVLGL